MNKRLEERKKLKNEMEIELEESKWTDVKPIHMLEKRDSTVENSIPLIWGNKILFLLVSKQPPIEKEDIYIVESVRNLFRPQKTQKRT